MEQWTSDYKQWMPVPPIYKVEVLIDWEWIETEFTTSIKTEKKPKWNKQNNIRITCERYFIDEDIASLIYDDYYKTLWEKIRAWKTFKEWEIIVGEEPEWGFNDNQNI